MAVEMPAEMSRAFYEGYANDTLWPLFHGFPTASSSTRRLAGLRGANHRFADAVLEHVRPGDLVWVHDYQLMLVPGCCARRCPQARIGFFLHIPFPSSEVFRILPRREELLRGLLGRRPHRRSTPTTTGTTSWPPLPARARARGRRWTGSTSGGRRARLEALPIGIDAGVPARLERDGRDRRQRASSARGHRFGGASSSLGVDRLDYTKGIAAAAAAPSTACSSASPAARQGACSIQVAVPSRERVAGLPRAAPRGRRAGRRDQRRVRHRRAGRPSTTSTARCRADELVGALPRRRRDAGHARCATA